jgi:copper chaperone CopZ
MKTMMLPNRIAPLSVTVLVAMSMLSVTPMPAYAEIEVARITVDGMWCNLCALELERSLRHVKGIETIRVVAASQQATIRLKPANTVDLAELREAVERAGQNLRATELLVRGGLERIGGRYRLRLAGVPQMFFVRDNVKLLPFVGKNVRVQGRVVSSNVASVELELVEIRPL